MSILLTGVLQKIRAHVSKLDVPTDPKTLAVTALSGSYILLTATPMQQMMIFIEGITGLSNDLNFKFQIDLDGTWFDWYDGNGDLITITVAGNEKRVIGPFQCPMKTAAVRFVETSGIALQEPSLVKTVASQPADVQDVFVFNDGSYVTACEDGYVRKYSATDVLQWEDNTLITNAYRVSGDLDTGDVYAGSYGGVVIKLNSAGVFQWSEDFITSIRGLNFCDGNVYVAHYGSGCSKITPAHSVVWTYATSSSCYDVIKTAYGVYCTSSNDIVKLDDSDGSFLDSYDTSSPSSIYSITADPLGNIIVGGGDSGVFGLVVKVSKDLVLIWEKQISTDTVYSVSASIEGEVYCATYSIPLLTKLNADGKTLFEYTPANYSRGIQAWGNFLYFASEDSELEIIESVTISECAEVVFHEF